MSELAYKRSEFEKMEPAVDATVKEVFCAIKRLCEPDVLYDIAFDENDGMLFKRFGRTLPVEAWLIALPVDDEGKPRRDKECVVSALAFSPKTVYGIGAVATLADRLKTELGALVEADS